MASALLKLCKGDIRCALSVLLACHAAYDTVGESKAYLHRQPAAGRHLDHNQLNACVRAPDVVQPYIPSRPSDLTVAVSRVRRAGITTLKTERVLALHDHLNGAEGYFETIEPSLVACVHLLDRMVTIECVRGMPSLLGTRS
jgi:replication factor C subunit 3/5